MTERRGAQDQGASAHRLARDLQAALDEAEAAHRAALAAYRRAGDTLLELTRTLRSWPPQGGLATPIQTGHVTMPELRLEPVSPPMLVSIREASEIAGIGKSTLWRLLGSGAFCARKVGNRTLIEYSSLRAWMESLPVWSGQPSRGKGERGDARF